MEVTHFHPVPVRSAPWRYPLALPRSPISTQLLSTHSPYFCVLGYKLRFWLAYPVWGLYSCMSRRGVEQFGSSPGS